MKQLLRCSLFRSPLYPLSCYIFQVFSNEAEADTFAEVNKFETTDRKVIAKKIAEVRAQTMLTQYADKP